MFCVLTSSCKSFYIVLGIFQLFLLVFISFALQINVQTDSTDAHPSLPPPTKVLKNKALLCKPLVRNKGVSCKTQTAECGAQTGKSYTCLHLIVALTALLPAKTTNKATKLLLSLYIILLSFSWLLNPFWDHREGGGAFAIYIRAGDTHEWVAS